MAFARSADPYETPVGFRLRSQDHDDAGGDCTLKRPMDKFYVYNSKDFKYRRYLHQDPSLESLGLALGGRADYGWAYAPVRTQGEYWEKGKPKISDPGDVYDVLFVMIGTEQTPYEAGGLAYSPWNVACAGRQEASFWGVTSAYGRRNGNLELLQERLGMSVRALCVRPRQCDLSGIWGPIKDFVATQIARHIIVEFYGWPSYDVKVSHWNGYFEGNSVYTMLENILHCEDCRVRLGTPSITSVSAYRLAAAKEYLHDPALPLSLNLPESVEIDKSMSDDYISDIFHRFNCAVMLKTHGSWCGQGVSRCQSGKAHMLKKVREVLQTTTYGSITMQACINFSFEVRAVYERPSKLCPGRSASPRMVILGKNDKDLTGSRPLQPSEVLQQMSAAMGVKGSAVLRAYDSLRKQFFVLAEEATEYWRSCSEDNNIPSNYRVDFMASFEDKQWRLHLCELTENDAASTVSRDAQREMAEFEHTWSTCPKCQVSSCACHTWDIGIGYCQLVQECFA